MEQASRYRLPRTVLPRHYDLVLTPDLPAATFTGVVTVTIDVAEETSDMVLNAADLEIGTVCLTSADGSVISGAATLAEDQRAVLRFDRPVPAGAGHVLHLEFAGVLNDKLHGFYRSSFVDAHGVEQVIATTQFESTDARRAFPCWDEPDLKATFAVTLVVAEDLTAISNGSIVSEERTGDGRRRVRFATTMLMSTYLLAFVVGPFELTEPLDVDGIPLRIATPPGRSHLTAYAAEVGAHSLRFLSRYFELAYPHDKIDHVAIPDFAFGAMENLGCVTYRENALLLDLATASQLELQRVATVVAHETAHMWFGDLVTMRWWNGIWLNEAFATFMELTTTEALRADWDVWTTFGLGKADAMATDGLRATRPVEFEVERPADADAMFDVLTYKKGGAVLRMLEQYLGPEVFRVGIARYLEQHRYGNTETADLWDAIEAVSGQPVRQIMDSWIFQGGYPLLRVAPGPDDHSLTVSQDRFLLSADSADSAGPGRPGADAPGHRADDPRERWAVPINLRASVGGAVRSDKLLLEEDSAVVRFDGPLDWVMLNDGGWGFYRVDYEPALLQALSSVVGRQTTALERMALVDDTWSLVVAGREPLRSFVALVRALADEEDPDVWATVVGALRTLDLVVSETDRPILAGFVRDLLGPAFARVGWDPNPEEPRRRGVLRSRLIAALGLVGADPEVRAEAARRFARYLADQQGLAPDVITATVNVVVAGGGAEAWATMFEEYRRAGNPQDQIRYLMSLTATDDPALLARTLDATLSAEIRSQDAYAVVAAILGSRAGGPMAWRWLTGHWEEIRRRLPTNSLIRALEGITGLVGPGLAEEVHAWIASTELGLADQPVAQLEERLDILVALHRRIGTTMAAELAGR